MHPSQPERPAPPGAAHGQAVMPLYARLKPPRAAHAPPARARAAKPRHNWPLYLFLFLLPLQNIQTGYLPNLGAGLNFLNVFTLLSLLAALRCGGKLERGSGVNRWMLIYVLWSVVSLFVGYGAVTSDTAPHAAALKDHLTGLFLLFLVQWSVTDWRTWKRVLIATLVPLPYIAKVTWVQNQSVSGYHYSDDLRIQGTFSLLGANEFAAFCITVALVVLGLLLAARTDRIWKVFLCGALVCALLGVIYAYSRAGYIAILLGALLAVLLWRGRMRAVLPAIVLAVALPVLLPNSVIERFDSVNLKEGERDASTESRFEFWGVAWDIYTRNPVIGSGYHTFHHKELNPYGMDAHNFFMRELTEKGAVGFAIVVVLLMKLFRAARRAMKQYPPGTFPHGLALGFAGAWIALVAGSCFGDRFTYYPMVAYFWAYAGLVLAALRMPAGGAAANAH